MNKLFELYIDNIPKTEQNIKYQFKNVSYDGRGRGSLKKSDLFRKYYIKNMDINKDENKKINKMNFCFVNLNK